MRSGPLWIITVVAGLCCLVFWQQWEIRGLKQDLVATAAAQADAQQQLTRLRRPAAALVAPPAAAEAAQHQRDVAAIAPWRRDLRRAVLGRYQPVFAALNLPADTLATLKDLLVAQSLAPFDARDAALAQGLPEGSPGMKAAIDRAVADVDLDITHLLGPEVVGRFQTLTAGMNVAPVPDVPPAAPAVVPPPVTVVVAPVPQWVDPGLSDDEELMVPAEDAAVGLTLADEVLIARAGRTLSPAQLQEFRRDRMERHAQVRQPTGPTPGAVPPGSGRTVTRLAPASFW